jgi:hypothetical protein
VQYTILGAGEGPMPLTISPGEIVGSGAAKDSDRGSVIGRGGTKSEVHIETYGSDCRVPIRLWPAEY